jgi:hypothetical protein
LTVCSGCAVLVLVRRHAAVMQHGEGDRDREPGNE